MVFIRSLAGFFLIMGVLGPVSFCDASVTLESTQPLVIPVDDVTPRLTSADVAKIIPTNIAPGTATKDVVNKIADKTIGYLMSSTNFKETGLGMFTARAQEKLRVDYALSEGSAQDVSHKLSFRLEAFQSQAKVEYSGWLNASINYDAKASATDIVLKESIFNNKILSLTHKSKKDQDLSIIGLAWQW